MGRHISAAGPISCTPAPAQPLLVQAQHLMCVPGCLLGIMEAPVPCLSSIPCHGCADQASAPMRPSAVPCWPRCQGQEACTSPQGCSTNRTTRNGAVKLPGCRSWWIQECSAHAALQTIQNCSWHRHLPSMVVSVQKVIAAHSMHTGQVRVSTGTAGASCELGHICTGLIHWYSTKGCKSGSS